MRLIDADKIVFDYSGLSYIAPSDGIGIAKYFADQIKSAPTITPESLVVHGRWEQSRIPCERFCCSICGGAAWYYDVNKNVKKSRYCPTCGSKMDLKE